MKNSSRKASKNNQSKNGGMTPEQAKQAALEKRAAAAEKKSNQNQNKQKSQNKQAQNKPSQPRNKYAGKKIGQQPPKKSVQAAQPAAEPANEKTQNSVSPDSILYKVVTKRDSDVLKAFITFTYRVYHPGVTPRLIIAGIMVALPSVIATQPWLKAVCLGLGALLILLALFRQFISLALTKSKDADYRNGTVFTYEFTPKDASFYSGTTLSTYLTNYKDIISFYYDRNYYYLGLKNRDFFILPKSRFTVGDAEEFEGFIYSKSKKACVWVPDNFRDQMKKRRAARTLNSK